MSQAEDIIIAVQGKGGLEPEAYERVLGAFWAAYGQRYAPDVPDAKADDADREKVMVLAVHGYIADIVAAYDPTVKAIEEQAAQDIAAARGSIDLGEPEKPEPKPDADGGVK